MFKLNEKGAVLSGVFYGILLLFLFLVLGSIIVLGNGRKALRQAKDNAINELNSKSILVDKVVLDSTNTSGGSYQTNNVDKNLLDINVSLSNSKATIVVTLYNNTSTPYTFSGIKYHNFTNSEKDTYPLLTFYNSNTDIVIDESSFSSVIDTVIAPNSTIEVPLEFIFNPNVTNPSKSIRSFIIFKVKENAISGSNIKTLSFNAGVPNLKVANQEYEVNSTLGVLPTITRDGYLLSGWYNGSTKLESTTKITDNMVATAKWITLLANGTVVYYNPVTNAKCTASQAVSTTGTKTGCMKWYAFNDKGADTVNLLLDHNTTAKVAWASEEDYIAAGGTEAEYGNRGNNNKGPITALKQLKNDTSSWNKSINARLIEASEIAKITNNTAGTAGGSSYYFHTNSTTQYTGASGTNKYAWLFDKTYDCAIYGCNVEDSSTFGYWTNTVGDTSTNARVVVYCGLLSQTNLADTGGFGVRPVVTVSRSIIS